MLFRRRRKRVPSLEKAPDTSESESGFGPVGDTPIIYLSFYLDLPLDAGVSGGRGFNTIEFGEPPLEDWSDFDLQGFVSMPPLPEPAVRPCTALYFHRVTGDVPPPFANVEKVLGSLSAGVLASDELPPFPESHTVVRAVRVVPRASVEFGNDWLREQFSVVFRVLNKMLLALGAAADDYTIGPITVKQLPPIILGFQGDMRNTQGGEINGLESFLYAVYKVGGVREDHNASVINYALSIADHEGHGPFYPAMEFLFAAMRSLDVGLLSQAVLESGTAIELLVNRVVLGVELEKGSSQERIDNIMERTSFKNLVKDHLAPRLGVPLDEQSRSDPLNSWFWVAYVLRNQVAHRGRKPTPEEAVEAIRLAHELVYYVADAIEQGGGFGITFPSGDERRPHPMLDERSLARADSSSLPVVRKNAFWRGRAAARSGDAAAAKQAFIEADERGSTGAAYNLAVMDLADEGDEAAGIAALRRATERGHPVAPAHLGAYLLEAGDEVEAERLFLRTPPTHPVGGSLAAYYLAGIVAGRGELAEAADFYKQASVYDEFAFAGDAAFRRGLILQELGDAAAVGAFERGAELGSVEAASYLANLLRTRGDADGAIVACERALALSGPDTEGWIIFNLASLLDSLGRPSDAKPIYERAVGIGETRALIRLAGMAAEANYLDTARGYLVTARNAGDAAVQAAVAALSADFQIRLD
jgi:hypothetical protein